MSETTTPDSEQPPARAGGSPIGHATAIGAAGFAWCSLALGLTTIGAFSAANGSIILVGTFFSAAGARWTPGTAGTETTAPC